MSRSRTCLMPIQRAAAPRPSEAGVAQRAPESRSASSAAQHQLDAVPAQRVVQLGKKKGIRRGKVGHDEREMARQGRAGAGAVFGNREGLLPAAPKGHHYEEIQPAGPAAGAVGAGEHRVVILKDHTGKAVKQYATYTHYGDGDSARKGKADFTEF